MYSARIESEETLYQRVFYACQTIRNRPGNFARVPMRTKVQVEDILSGFLFFVNFDLMHSKNWTPIKLETCNVNVLCQLWVKYCIIQVFIVERHLAIKLKDRSFPDCLCEMFALFCVKN